jgi:hypothetical protein
MTPPSGPVITQPTGTSPGGGGLLGQRNGAAHIFHAQT